MAAWLRALVRPLGVLALVALLAFTTASATRLEVRGPSFPVQAESVIGPFQPTAVTAVNGTASGQVLVSWTAPSASGVLGYFVLRFPVSGGDAVTACETRAEALTTATSCTDSDVSGTTDLFRYRVVAVYDTGAAPSGFSDPLALYPDRLILSTAPSTEVTGGIPFDVQPVVTLLDATHATAIYATTQVSLVLYDVTGTTPVSDGSAHLTCTQANNTVQASSGVASFSGCAIDHAGTFTIKAVDAAAGSLAAPALSEPIVVAVPPAVSLVFTTTIAVTSLPPASVTAGSRFAVAVAVLGVGGQVLVLSSEPVSLVLTAANGATVACEGTSTKVTPLLGIAVFTGCHIDKAGAGYALTARASGVTWASTDLSVTPDNAHHLTFAGQPADATAGQAIGTPVVEIRDIYQNVTTDTARTVTLSLTNPQGALLTCQAATVTTGQRSFGACGVDRSGTYRLRATAPGLTSATSDEFTISAGDATQLVFTVQPSPNPVSSGGAFGATVALQDAHHNTDPSAIATVTLRAGNDPIDCETIELSEGVVAFDGCQVTVAGSYTVTATSPGLTTATAEQSLVVT